MKTSLMLLMLTLLYCSCTKTQTDTPTQAVKIDGNWVMTLYIDSVQNLRVLKPKDGGSVLFDTSSYDNSIQIVYKNSTNDSVLVTGRTKYNGFSCGFRTSPTNDISMLRGVATLVMDNVWGDYCLNTFFQAKSYSIDDSARLIIKAPKKSLVFTRK